MNANRKMREKKKEWRYSAVHPGRSRTFPFHTLLRISRREKKNEKQKVNEHIFSTRIKESNFCYPKIICLDENKRYPNSMAA